MKDRGFTLLEMMVVLCVLALLTGVALPYLRFGGPDAATAAKDLSASLAAARSRALSIRRPVTLAVDLTDGRFGIAGGEERALPAGLSVRWTVAAGQTDGRQAAITFFPDGGSTGGRLLVTGRGRDAAIDVDWLTGSIRRE